VAGNWRTLDKSKPSPIDQAISAFDQVLRITTGNLHSSARPSPTAQPVTLSRDEMQLSASFMRVNHTGEVCAQALYKGQALTARDHKVTETMSKAALEEEDHLVWCEERIKALGSHVSYLNPVWYAGSMAMGALAGAMGNRINLGFVAATEEEVVEHLEEHLQKLPQKDSQSRVILEQMKTDEARHAHKAIESGGSVFPAPVKSLMRGVSRLMTRTAYWI
jgi:3-demethoxyubiquinol 3-hydroxylase